ncbi:unnamed protein product [Paramecium sonneborni]|uniref:Uncharacterized protein n=1 Tax=Paramecium sonneborni TaxID=65129 RepID=A0A8S1RSH9_9CILI|nr:unnamed protein product [Paramecium sonneborni]
MKDSKILKLLKIIETIKRKNQRCSNFKRKKQNQKDVESYQNKIYTEYQDVILLNMRMLLELIQENQKKEWLRNCL